MLFPFLLLLLRLSSNAQPAAAPAETQVLTIESPSIAQKLVKYAKTLQGVTYKYGASNPEVGFDCSGFVHHVFRRFGIDVPRSSVGFKNTGTAVRMTEAAPGDVVLFKGTDPENSRIGHIGIVVENVGGDVKFIHSTSGKRYSVTITPLSGHYETRFVKVIRIL